MSSFIGKMLFVDLSTVTIEERTIPGDWVELYTGQKGLGARMLMEDFSPQTDPLSPENRIVLTTSIIGGTIISSSAKLAITTKSPQTGTISDGSVGGHIGAELKYAGYDAIVISGRADSLSYLYIDPDRAEIRTAENLKGLGTFKVDHELKQMLGDSQVKILSIGPAGENLIPFSCISSEKYGGQSFAMQIKGLELPGYDPRGSWGMGISYVTAPRGGCHMSAYPIAEEAWGDLDPFTYTGKAGLVVEMQNAQFAKFSIRQADAGDGF
jgi:aldehyde:ferredoxin oxidoreductase